MDRPSRTVKKRLLVSNDDSDSDEDYSPWKCLVPPCCTPKKKSRKVTKPTTEKTERPTRKRTVKDEGQTIEEGEVQTRKRTVKDEAKTRKRTVKDEGQTTVEVEVQTSQRAVKDEVPKTMKDKVKRTVKVEVNAAATKHIATCSKKVKESKVENEISEVNGQVATKASSFKTTLETIRKNNNNVHYIWDESEMLSHVERVPLALARSFVSLLTEGCTLPFICRYRKSNVNYLMPDRLQELFDSYQSVTLLKKKVKTVIETLSKSNKLTPEVEKSLLNARTLSEVELVYAPLKTHALSLAERARGLGLEPVAIKALNGEFVNIISLCTNHEELASPEKVETHIMHIVADIICKDTRVLEYMRGLKEETRFTITSSRTKSSTKEKKETENKQDKKSDPETYKIYFEWKCPSQFVKPHQTLALNRGEDEKVLSIKVVVPDWFYNKLERFCLTLWSSSYWVHKGLGDAYARLIKPWLSRQVRNDLTSAAQKEAVKTFTTNLEKYLLTEPVKNRIIVGLDPGFRAGCKVGIINANGDKLEACTLYPNLRTHNPSDVAARQLKELIRKFNVELIGLGNGTACRETEAWLRNHHVSDHVPVVIVPEQGASIYSISKEAQKEHPNMDPNLISALSIARRVLDPLGELIKVEPKNLGVGMYQHDIPPKMLESALECTVERVVSLVGVDINTASHAMLRRISGLNEGRANKILAYRQDKGGFTTRAEILKVTGVGKITYQQCAGFLKVLGGAEPLDSTIIHPESYSIAKAFAKKLGVNIKDLSKPHFPETVERLTTSLNLTETSEELNTDVCTLELIVNAFKQKAHEDNIITFCRPVYSMAVQATDQIREGTMLTGVVRNVVPFGCFVDCGVGDNGLIHRNHLGGCSPRLGDRVAVTVLASPQPRRLQLRLDRILD